MKKWLIGSLVGAIIIFLWQFLSWTVLHLHEADGRYTASQENILEALKTAELKDGNYFLPTAPPGTSMEEMEKLGKEMDGKPFAVVMYNTAYKHDMATPMIRGFLVNLFLVISFIYLITRAGTPTAMRVFAASVALGLVGFLWGVYTEHIWFQTPSDVLQSHLIDALVAWGLTGIWLGWWLNRK